MTEYPRWLTLVCTVLLAQCVACGRDAPRAGDEAGPRSADPELTAATLGDQTVLSTADYLELPPYAGADVEYGERLSLQCRACHTFEAGGPHMVGPNLHGFFGRAAGTVSDFPYSRALRGADFIWTPRALDAWLSAPTEFLRGTSMVYSGMREADDRAALIASLLRQTADGPAR